jgi:hypothetical protein
MSEKGFKQKAKEELRKFLIYFLYLAMFFCAFVLYRNLLIEKFSSSYLHYGFALFEALIISKVILIGESLRLGDRKFSGYPLIVPTLYKTVIFSLFVLAFSVVEHYGVGYIEGKSIVELNVELTAIGWNEILSRTLIKFVAFIPFFAFIELERVIGEGTISRLFIHKNKMT